MKSEIKIPSMGESISEATIAAILIPSGTLVKGDAEILELETDKVNQVLFAPIEGLLSLSVKAGDVVKIGQVIGYVDSEGVEDKKISSSLEIKKEEAPLSKGSEKEKLKETPREESVPIRQMKESFIADLKEEPKKSSATLPLPPRVKAQGSAGRETRRKMSKIRQVIAARLIEAQQSTAMLTTFNEVDMSQIASLREKYKETFAKKHGTKLGMMSFFVKACVSALKAFPDFNSYIDGDEVVHREYYNIGVAVGTDRGVIVPILRDCDQLTFAEIERALEGYAAKAREGKLSVDDLQGGGFTITNGGVYGSLLSTPILPPSQTGILGMHKMEKRPVVIDDQIVIRPMMYLALSYDHRLVDGKEAVSFLVHIKNALEDPSRVLLEL